MDSEQCACCLEDITRETGKTVMGCGHSFHFMCLVSWFDVQVRDHLDETCPCCRRQGTRLEILPYHDWAAEEEQSQEQSQEEQTQEQEQSQEEQSQDDEQMQENGYAERLAAARLQVTIANDLALSAGSMLQRIVSGEEMTLDHIEATRSALESASEQSQYARAALETFGPLPSAPFAPFAPSASSLPSPRFSDEQIEDRMYRAWMAVQEGQRILQQQQQEPTPPPIVRLRISWTRTSSGAWVRQVLNPEDDEPHMWSDDEGANPPDSLVIQTSQAANKIQAIWRGHRQRTVIGAARAMINIMRS